MSNPTRDADDRPNDMSDEARIRADERARLEHELRSMQDDDRIGGDRYVNRGDADDDRRVVAQPVVEERVEEIEVVRKRAFSVGQLLTMLAGAALVVLGIFALIETGVDSLTTPVEEVMGYSHTPLLGILEIIAGGLLVLFSLRPGGRWLVAVVGLALVVGGLLILGQLDWTQTELGAEQGYAWIPIVAGAVALLSALITPRRYQRLRGIPSDRRI